MYVNQAFVHVQLKAEGQHQQSVMNFLPDQGTQHRGLLGGIVKQLKQTQKASSSLVEVAKLFSPEITIEIEAILGL